MAKNINRNAVRSMKGETVDFSKLRVATGSATQDINSRQRQADKTDAVTKKAAITIKPPRANDPAAPAIMEKIAKQKKSIRAERKTTTVSDSEKPETEEAVEE